MGTIAFLLKVEAESVSDALRQALEKLDSCNGELVLDFSSVGRLAPAAIRELAQLVDTATGCGVKLALRGVNIDIYKVLKLARLAPRISFLS